MKLSYDNVRDRTKLFEVIQSSKIKTQFRDIEETYYRVKTAI